MRWAVVLCLGAACAAPGTSVPVVDHLEPAAALNVDPTSVSVIGSGLELPLTSNIDTGKASAGALAVSLGDIPLDDVVWVDATHIDATVPAGLTPGLYDITVTLGGATDTLPMAFEVQELGAFGAPTMITQLSSGTGEDDATLTADELELFYNSNRAGTGGADIWVSTRASVTDPWGTPTEVTALNSPMLETTPGITADGLTMYFGSDRAGAGNTDIYVSTRTSRSGPWSAPMLVAELSTSAFSEHGVQPSASGLQIVFNSNRGGTTAAYLSTRAAVGDPWGPPRLLSELVAGYEADPSIAQQDQVIVFTANTRGGTGLDDLYLARRATAQDPFGAPVEMTELDSPQSDSDGWLSEDLRHIVFTSNRNGTSEIWEARR